MFEQWKEMEIDEHHQLLNSTLFNSLSVLNTVCHGDLINVFDSNTFLTWAQFCLSPLSFVFIFTWNNEVVRSHFSVPGLRKALESDQKPHKNIIKREGDDIFKMIQDSAE